MCVSPWTVSLFCVYLLAMKQAKFLFLIIFVVFFISCGSESRKQSDDSPDQSDTNSTSASQGNADRSLPPEQMDLGTAQAVELFSLQSVDMLTKEEWPLSIEFLKDRANDDEYTYCVIFQGQEYRGAAELIDFNRGTVTDISSIKLYDFPWVENPQNTNNPVWAINRVDGELVMQSCGNSMNPYTIIDGPKYLSFNPIEGEQTTDAAGLPSHLQGLNAEELNDLGFAEYQKKNYSQAVELFEYAHKVDPHYAYALFNAACSLSLMMAAGEEVEENKILEYLHKSTEIDSTRWQKIHTDSDLESFRQTKAYQSLIDGERNPYLRIIQKYYSGSYLQYYSQYLYKSDVCLLLGVQPYFEEYVEGAKRVFLNLSQMSIESLENSDKAVVMFPVYFSQDDPENTLAELEEGSNESVFGYLGDKVISQYLQILLVNGNSGKVLANQMIHVESPTSGPDFSALSVYSIPDSAGLAFTYKTTNFASGSYTQLHPVWWPGDGHGLEFGEILTIWSEDLSGGEASFATYPEAPWVDNNSLVIQEYSNDKPSGIKVLLELNIQN